MRATSWLGREVAIKILPGEFAQDANLKVRFEREARTISHLAHPNICTLFDVGENYLVMELLERESLADRLQLGPLPLADVARIGAQTLLIALQTTTGSTCRGFAAGR